MNKKKLTIIHVAQFLGIGGLEKIIFNLSKEQIAHGHDVKVYIYDYERTWVKYFIDNGIRVVTPKIKKPGYDFNLIIQMYKDLFQSDIVHAHDLNPLMYLGPIFFFKKITIQKRPKLIHSIHGMSYLTENKKNILYQFLFSHFPDQTIGVSEGIGKFFLEKIKINKKKFQVINNGVPSNTKITDSSIRKLKRDLITKKHALDSTRPIILSLSRITPLKNQLFLIYAFNQRKDYQLIIAGPSDNTDYIQKLKKIANSNIIFIGPQESIDDYNLGTDLYVSASTHEGIPVAVLEAMMVESPCLVSNIEGHLTLLKHGLKFETFSLDNIENFLCKIDRIFENYFLTKEEARKGREIVMSKFSVEEMASKHIEVYLK